VKQLLIEHLARARSQTMANVVVAPVQAVNAFLQELIMMFAIVMCGYLGARFDLLPAPLMGGLGRVLGTFALPALLFKTTVSPGLAVINRLIAFRTVARSFSDVLCESHGSTTVLCESHGSTIGPNSIPCMPCQSTLEFTLEHAIFLGAVFLAKFLVFLATVTVSFIADQKHDLKRRYIQAGLRGETIRSHGR
jgi:hypothetical protein